MDFVTPRFPRVGKATLSEMGESEYRQHEGVNASCLPAILKSPLHWKHAFHTPMKETQEMVLGKAVHAALLEPDSFSSLVVAIPDLGDMRSSKNREVRDQWLAALGPDTIALKASEFELIEPMRQAVLGHPVARSVFSRKGRAEQVILWDDEESGLGCKAKLDWLVLDGARPVIADLKTARDASPAFYRREIFRLGKDIQQSHYCAAVKALTGVDPIFAFFVVENTAPHGVSVFTPDEAFQEIGERRRRQCLTSLSECIAYDNFPGYSQDAVNIGPPTWAFYSEGED